MKQKGFETDLDKVRTIKKYWNYGICHLIWCIKERRFFGISRFVCNMVERFNHNFMLHLLCWSDTFRRTSKFISFFTLKNPRALSTFFFVREQLLSLPLWRLPLPVVIALFYPPGPILTDQVFQVSVKVHSFLRSSLFQTQGAPLKPLIFSLSLAFVLLN